MERLFQITFTAFLCSCLTLELIASDDFSQFLDEAREMRKTNPSGTLNIIEKYFNENEITEDERGELFYLQALIHKQDFANQESALINFYNALKFFRQSNNQEREYESLFYVAQTYKNLFHYDYAIDYYQEALELDHLDDSQLRVVKYNLSRVLRLNERYDEAINILTKLCEFYENGDQEWLMICKTELALTLLENRDYKESTKHYLQVIQLTEQYGDYAGFRGKAINSVGYIKLQQKQLDEAEEFLLKGLNLKEGSVNQQSLLLSYLNLGELYQELGQSETAVRYFEKGIELELSAVNHQSMIEALEELAYMADIKDELRKALDYQKRIIDIQEPYVELSERLEILHSKYKAERVKYLNEKIELQAKLILSQNRNLIGALIFTGCLVLAFVGLFWQYRKLKIDHDLIGWLRKQSKLLFFLQRKYNIDLEQAEKELDRGAY